MTIAHAVLDRAIEAIYDTTVAPERWPDALTVVTECFNGAGTLLYFRRAEGTYSTLYSPSLAEAAADFFTGGWATQDVRAIRAEERGLHLTLPCVTDEDVVTPEELETHPYYTKFLAAHGLKWFMGSSISPDPTEFVVLSVQQYASRPPFTPEQKQHLELLARHAERALRLSCRLMRAEISNQALGVALNSIGCGVALLNKSEDVIFTNEVGAPFVTVLGGRKRVLLSPHRSTQRLPALAGGSFGEMNALADFPSVAEGEGGIKAVAHRLPVTSATRDLLAETFGDVHAMVLFLVPSAREPVDPALIRDMMGITLGEARIASLVGAGLSPRESADALGVTEETARTLLKRVYSKTNISKQSELAALLTQLSLRNEAPPPRPGQISG